MANDEFMFIWVAHISSKSIGIALNNKNLKRVVKAKHERFFDKMPNSILLLKIFSLCWHHIVCCLMWDILLSILWMRVKRLMSKRSKHNYCHRSDCFFLLFIVLLCQHNISKFQKWINAAVLRTTTTTTSANKQTNKLNEQ